MSVSHVAELRRANESGATKQAEQERLEVSLKKGNVETKAERRSRKKPWWRVW
jgi:hypothetical protein